MNRVITNKYIAVFALSLVAFFGVALNAYAGDAQWAQGNLGFNQLPSNGDECPVLMIGNETTGDGITQAHPSQDRCWATQIPPVQPGQTFSLLIKAKNKANATDIFEDVRYRLTPGGTNALTSSRTFTATVYGFDAGTYSSMAETASDSVTVHLSSPQKITLLNMNYYPPTGGVAAGMSASSLISSALYRPGDDIYPNEAGYIKVKFKVENTNNNGGNNGNTGQGPDVETVGTVAGQPLVNSLQMKGWCDANGSSTKTWFELKQYLVPTGGSVENTYQTNKVSKSIVCGAFQDTKGSLPAGYYEFRACGENAYGDDCGDWKGRKKVGNPVVTIDPGNNNGGNTTNNPAVDTDSATSIGVNSARLNATILDEGAGVKYTWFALDEYNDDPTPSCSDVNQKFSVNVPYGTGTGDSFDRSITILNDDTKYAFRACLQDHNNDLAVGPILTFTTDDNNNGGGNNNNNDDVEVRTLSATDVDEDSARLRGEVIDEGEGNVDVWFVIARTRDNADMSCDTNDNDVDYISVSGSYNDGDDFSKFSKKATNLQDDEEYEYRACIEDADGNTDDGSLREFTTDDTNNNNDDLDIQTNAASSIDSDSAKLRGEVREEGAGDVSVWFVYAKTSDNADLSCDTNDNDVEYEYVSGDYGANDDFSRNVNGLVAGTNYEYRACGEDQDGEEDGGAIRTFKTDNTGGNGNTGVDIDSVNVPSITTVSANRITSNSAVVVGAYTARTCSDLQTYFTLGSTPNNLSIRSDFVNRNSAYGVGQESFTGLSSGSAYYYQFNGICDGQLYSGDIKSFATPGVAITTPPVTPNIISSTPVSTPSTGGGDGSCVSLRVTNDLEGVIIGQDMTYRIELQNKCGSRLNGGVLNFKLDQQVKFLGTSRGQYNPGEHAVVMDLGIIENDEKVTAVVTGRVRSGNGELILAEAIFGGSTDEDGDAIQQTEIQYDVDPINRFGGGAASAFGSGFFLGSPWGWLIVLAGLGLLVLGARSFYVAGARGANKRGAYAPVYNAMTPMYQQPMMTPNVPAASTVRTAAAPSNLPVDSDPNAYTRYQPQAYDAASDPLNQ